MTDENVSILSMASFGLFMIITFTTKDTCETIYPNKVLETLANILVFVFIFTTFHILIKQCKKK